MLAAHVATLALLGLSPALLLLDGAIPHGLIEIYAAVALALAALAIRPGEAAHLVKTLRRAAILAALPAAWLILQLLPMPGLGGVSGSIWQSAAAALGTPMWSRISIDPGLTLLTLFHYLAIAAVVLAAAAATLERTQAERLFYALGAAAAVIALIAVIDAAGARRWLGDRQDPLRASAIAASCYGVVLFAGIVVLAVERRGTRQKAKERTPFLPMLGAAGLGFAVCLLATLAGAPGHAAFAAGCGLTTVFVVYVVRRLGFGWLAGLAMGAVAAIGAALIASANAPSTATDLALRYAAWAGGEPLAAAERMLAGAGLFGSGGGTFDALYRLHTAQDAGGMTMAAPTFAGRIAVEFGRIALSMFVAAAAFLALLCAAGGFSRGRDFVYPAIGAGLVVVTLVLAFCDDSLSNSGVAVLLATALGLALAQSTGRTT